MKALLITQLIGMGVSFALLKAAKNPWPRKPEEWFAWTIAIIVWPTIVCAFLVGGAQASFRAMRPRYRVTAAGARRRIVSGPVGGYGRPAKGTIIDPGVAGEWAARMAGKPGPYLRPSRPRADRCLPDDVQ